MAVLAEVVRRPQSAVEHEARSSTEIFADLDRFNTERFDDQTLIVMEWAIS